MAKKLPQNYRIRVTKGSGEISYIVRTGAHIAYTSGSEVPMKLADLVSAKAMELRFKLEDALNGDAAIKALRALMLDAKVEGKAELV